MRTKNLFTFLGLVIFLNANAQQHDIAGLWEGKLSAGTDIRIVFHFTKNADKTYSAIMDSPDQGAKGIVCNNVQFLNDSVSLEISSIKGSFKGTLMADSLIDGRWQQGPASLPLKIKKVLRVSHANRPQTPQPPFSYNNEEVEYDNADKSIHFGASFTFPTSGGPFPAILMITGSGQQDRDETIFEHKPFAIIADYLTKAGYAILRVDDRGVGKTTGDIQSATSMDFANDAEVGLNWLKSRKEADKSKIGLLGHSEGGLIAAIIAARNNNIAFVIMLAGPGINGADLLTGQMGAIVKSAGVSPEATEAYKIVYKNSINFTITEKDSSSAYAKAYPAYVEWKKKQSAGILSALGITSDEANDKKMIGTMVAQFGKPWMKYFLSSDPAPMIEKFSCKVLALNGSKDIQVLPDSNLEGIRLALTKSKTKVFEVKKLEGLNHLFQHCKTCLPSEYGTLEESFAPEALTILREWLDNNVK